MREEFGCRYFWKVETQAPQNAVSYPTQETDPQKQSCPNLTRTDNYPPSDVNQCFRRMQSSYLTDNTTISSTTKATWPLSKILVAKSVRTG
jgi:hypothetical protein